MVAKTLKCPHFLNGWWYIPSNRQQYDQFNLYLPQVRFLKPVHTSATAGYRNILVNNKDHSEFTEVVIDKSHQEDLCDEHVRVSQHLVFNNRQDVMQLSLVL